ARYWGKWSDDAEIEKAAQDFLGMSADDPERLLKHIRIFEMRRFPLAPDNLIQLIKEAGTKPEYNEDDRFTTKTQIVVSAFRALAHVSHPDVRQLALDLIEKRHWIGYAASLLLSNWELEDWALMEMLTKEQLDPFDYHGLGLDILAIFRQHPAPEAAQALFNLYEYGPCSFCRESWPEALASINRLPDWMREECRHDSSFDLREWAENLDAPQSESTD
ncbi:MAG: hypothetical protein GYB65_15665, partial [Chloroflexi bacterium]|nr:hypothetical protein [Chloroflexota bacterium]